MYLLNCKSLKRQLKYMYSDYCVFSYKFYEYYCLQVFLTLYTHMFGQKYTNE